MPAIQQHFLPDSISTDLHIGSMNSGMKDMLNVMGKFLALGLSRLARTATTQKVCTVYIVDVSESVPDASLEDARREIQKGIDAKPKDGGWTAR